jgi:hypothetical protein
MPGASPAEVEKRVSQLMARIADNPHRPPPPLSQSLEDVDDPYYGLGTHPDIVTRLWSLDELLPQRCRWVYWGKPSLVHPKTGVVFAVGFGTIGLVMRLPPKILREAQADQAPAVISGNPGQTFDIGPAGPEWHFVPYSAPAAVWCLAAYDLAAETRL